MQAAKLPPDQATALREASAGGLLPRGTRRPGVVSRASSTAIRALLRRGFLRYDGEAQAYLPTDAGEELLGLEPVPTRRAQRVTCPTCGAAKGTACHFTLAPHDDAPNEHAARHALAAAVYAPPAPAGG